MQVTDAPTAIIGFQVRAADGTTPLGEVDEVSSRALRIHRIPGHAGHVGFLPLDAIDRVDKATDTVILTGGVDMERLIDAPTPPDAGAWHKSPDWWASLLGHYGLFEAEGRSSEPFLHPDQR